MGVKDSFKKSAQGMAGEARRATARGKAKVEEAALRRRLDEHAKRLGYLLFRERTQGTPAGADADTLIADMRALEDQIARSGLESSEPQA
jgi:hypothetical protein